MREDHWDPIEMMGRHRQHREGGPTFQAGSSQQIVQAGAVVPQIVGRQPDGQQVLVRHVPGGRGQQSGCVGCPLHC